MIEGRTEFEGFIHVDGIVMYSVIQILTSHPVYRKLNSTKYYQCFDKKKRMMMLRLTRLCK